MSEKLQSPKLHTDEIKRRDLLSMAKLTQVLDENDIVYLSNRGELDAVIVRPKKLLSVLNTKSGVKDLVDSVKMRLSADETVSLSEGHITILKAVEEAGSSRMIEIADRVERRDSNIFVPVQQLVEKGMLNRSEGEEIVYSLTEKGAQVLKETQ